MNGRLCRGASSREQMVRRAEGKFALAHCICRQGKDLIGQPCKVTDLRDTCIIFPQAAELEAIRTAGRVGN